MPGRADIVRVAREYLGTPYGHQGRQKGVILDCVGLVLCVAKELDLRSKTGEPLGMYTGYPRNPMDEFIQKECIRHFVVKREGPPSNLSELLPGDMVTMRVQDSTQYRRLVAKNTGLRNPITHIGIVSNLQGSIGVIHSYSGVRKIVIEHLIDSRWMRRIAGIFSFAGVTD